jgi:GAF domain-containing protein
VTAADEERLGQRELELAELGRFVVGEVSLEGAMLRIASAAKVLLEPVDEASITFVRGEAAWTAASTGNLATQLDEAQYDLGRGPCVDAASGGVRVSIPDLATDERWIEYGRRAVAAGAGSSLSLPFPVQEHVLAALNLYATTAHAFGEDEVELAREIAARAAVALVNAVRYESASDTADQLRKAMESRAVIEQAKGVIMGQSRCSAEEAFDVLVRASQRENRKLRDIALEIVERRSAPT